MPQESPETSPEQNPTPTRPSLERLLVHPIRKVDNGSVHSVINGASGGSSAFPEGNGGAIDAGCYDGWLFDHWGKARFYVGGFPRLRAITKIAAANYYHSYAERALEIAFEEKWNEKVDGAFKTKASYNQFLNPITAASKPMYFELAVQFLLACEAALEAAIKKGGYAGHRFDVYGFMKIIPACFNIDRFNDENLAGIKETVREFDLQVLTAAGQPADKVLKDLTKGHCVTRRTARAVRSETLRLLLAHPEIGINIGDVRGKPGTRHGRKGSTDAEVVELDTLSDHED